MLTTLALTIAVLGFAPSAHAAYFGQNKVQYDNFEWRVLETPHFEILFYDKEQDIVRDAARLAERAYTQLSATLIHEFEKRIPLILYASHADFQQTHITEAMIDVGTGGITELARRRVFLPFTGSYAELQHVLTHELVHAFELDILARADGSATPFGPMPPLWVMEGLAEYLSRGPGDPHTDMWIRDACLAGNLLSIEDMRFVRDIRAYRFGQSIWEFFAEQHGNDRIGDLLRALRDEGDLDPALKRVAQVSLSDFSDRWTTAMRRRHLPRIAKHQVAREFAEPVVTRSTLGAALVVSPSISPDGKQMTYVSDQNLNNDLYVCEIQGGPHARKLVAGEMSGDFESLRFFRAGSTWSPDGTTIAFSAKAGGEDALYLLDVESGRIVAKHTFGLDEVQTAAFSPDGQDILFVGIDAGQSDLYRVRRDGSDLRRVTEDRFVERDPQWSPDGRHVVYVGDEGPDTDLQALRFGRMHLLLLDLETGDRRDITPFDEGMAVSPAWSGDGEYVAFVSDRDGTPNIYILHPPTGQVFQLTQSVTGISGILPTSPALSWARGSDRIVFSVFSKGGWDVYRMDDPIGTMVPVELATGRIAAWTPEDRASTDLEPQSEFLERGYKVRLRPDLSRVGGVVGYEAGVGGESQIHFSDMLGNHSLSLGLGIYGSISESDLLVSYLNRSRRTNLSFSAFQFKKRYGVLGGRQSLSVERQTYRGIQVAAIRPFDRFSRVEASLQVAGVAGRFFLGETVSQSQDDPSIQDVRVFLGPGVAYVQDSALFGSTGPIKGRRMRLSLEGAIGQVQHLTLQADLRQYWNVRKHYAIAARLYATSSQGETPETRYLGGGQSLRGYDYGALVGNHALLASLELRFPLVQYLALGWPLPLELGNIRGVLFGDAATAWDDELFRTSRAVRNDRPGRAPQLSYGFGARLNLGYLVLKLDWAQRYDTGTGLLSRGSSVSLGADF